MKPRDEMTEAEIDENLAESFPASDPPSWTTGTDHPTPTTRHNQNRTKTVVHRSLTEKIFHQLARFFNGLHWAVGITTLPTTATSRDERSFVLMWLGIIVFMIVFFAAFLYVLGRI